MNPRNEKNKDDSDTSKIKKWQRSIKQAKYILRVENVRKDLEKLGIEFQSKSYSDLLKKVERKRNQLLDGIFNLVSKKSFQKLLNEFESSDQFQGLSSLEKKAFRKARKAFLNQKYENMEESEIRLLSGLLATTQAVEFEQDVGKQQILDIINSLEQLNNLVRLLKQLEAIS